MRTRCALVLVVAGLILGGARAGAQVTWADYTKPEARLTFSMPCAPTWQDGVADSPISGQYASHIGLCKSGDEIYLIGWVDYLPSYKPNIEAELKANQDNFNKGFNAVLLTSTRTTHQGLPALDFTANREQTLFVTSRVVMDGYRPYIAAIVTPINADRSDNIRRFMASFRIAVR